MPPRPPSLLLLLLLSAFYNRRPICSGLRIYYVPFEHPRYLIIYRKKVSGRSVHTTRFASALVSARNPKYVRHTRSTFSRHNVRFRFGKKFVFSPRYNYLRGMPDNFVNWLSTGQSTASYHSGHTLQLLLIIRRWPADDHRDRYANSTSAVLVFNFFFSFVELETDGLTEQRVIMKFLVKLGKVSL